MDIQTLYRMIVIKIPLYIFCVHSLSRLSERERAKSVKTERERTHKTRQYKRITMNGPSYMRHERKTTF